jgi:hypothetical protein
MRTRPVARGAETANDFHTLDGERHASARFQSEAGRTTTASKLSRSGTGSSGPLWNGPTLSPAFVAQVIGQVTEQKRSAPLAYRQVRAQIPPGSFIDNAV